MQFILKAFPPSEFRVQISVRIKCLQALLLFSFAAIKINLYMFLKEYETCPNFIQIFTGEKAILYALLKTNRFELINLIKP